MQPYRYSIIFLIFLLVTQWSQARFTLSTMEACGDIDGDFNQQRFFENIMSLFEMDPKDSWVVETLAWWNKYVSLLSKMSLAESDSSL